MTKVAFRSITGRRLRTALTALAIVLGVAMISGAFTLTDTMGKAADQLSASAYDGTDAVVTTGTAFEIEREGSAAALPTVAASTLERVRSVGGVETAVGSISDEAKVLDRNGEVRGTGPYFAAGLDSTADGAETLTPFRLREGRFAKGAGEVAIDAGTAESLGLGLGDRVEIQTAGPLRSFEVTGIVTFGELDALGTATISVFSLEQAQSLYGKEGSFDEILVAGDGSVPDAELQGRIAAEVPELAVESAAAQDRFMLDGLRQGIDIIRMILIAFGVVAVFVGAFTIFNTLSITVAQRAREFALARAVGATRRQVLRSVVLEALALGVAASAVGVIAGLGIAEGLQSLMASAGIEMPETATVFAVRTVIVAMVVGVLVTVVAGLGPALRATRVAPVAIMREGAAAEPGRLARHSAKVAAAVIALGVGVLALGLFADDVDAGGRLGLLAPGALLLFVGVALASPRLVPALAVAIGRVSARFGGPAGSLARANAIRNPGRTASTAAALMIGIALVSFVAVLGAGLRQATEGAIADQLTADYVLVDGDGYSPIDPGAVEAAAGAEGVEASALVQSPARAFGADAGVVGIDPGSASEMLSFEWAAGSQATLAGLGERDAVVTNTFAADNGLAQGERFELTAPSGERLSLAVAGITEPDEFNALGLGEVTVARSTFDAAFEAKRARFGLLSAADGVDPAALEGALAGYPSVEVQSSDEFAADQSAWVDQVLAIFYVLLGLAVIVSLFGIVNTMALSVVERTREIGMLKAIGMTRRQVRRMVRHESVITSLIGAVLGIGVGLFMAALVTAALSSEGLAFALPAGSLLAFVVLACLAGSIAAIGPARRAARLDPLEALSYE